MSATIGLSWATTLLGLDTLLLANPSSLVPIAPVEGPRAFNGHRLITGAEGRRATFKELTEAQYKTLVERSGGDGVYSVDGYIRCPMFDNDTGTVVWNDYICVIHMPLHAPQQQGPVWELRYNVVQEITDMTLYGVSVARS